jgi:hypothetical protein
MSPVFGQLPMAIRLPGSRTRTVISSHYQSMWAVERSSGVAGVQEPAKDGIG